jgi:outer membrane autotransporter protein
MVLASADNASAQQVKADGGTRLVPSGTIIDMGASLTGSLGYGLWAANGGVVAGSNIVIMTGGRFADGALASGVGSAINVSGGSIRTTGEGASGANSGSGTKIELKSMDISTLGDNSLGLRTTSSASAGGLIVASDVRIVTGGAKAFGAMAGGERSLIDISGGSIKTSGAGAHGAFANYGELKIESVDISTLGNRSHGVLVGGASASADVSGSTISVKGANSFGVRTENGGRAIVNDTRIHVTGRGSSASISSGGLVSSVDSPIDARNVEIAVVGAGTGAVVASGLLSISDSKIHVAGIGASGLVSWYSKGDLSASNVSIDVDGSAGEGASSYVKGTPAGVQLYSGKAALNNVSVDGRNGAVGVNNEDGALVADGLAIGVSGRTQTDDVSVGVNSSSAVSTITNSSIKVRGEDSVALWGRQGVGASSALSFTSSKIDAADSVAMRGSGGTTSFSFDNSSVLSRALLEIGSSEADSVNPTVVSVSAVNGSYLEGDANLEARVNRATLALDDSVLRGGLTNLNSVSLTANSRWLMTAASSADVLSVSDSEVEFSEGGAYKTLTVGSLEVNGGTFILNTKLNEGGAASETDKVVVTGDANGSGFIRIRNNGGSGAVTAEGIKIIEVAGASNGTFSLLSDYRTREGEGAVVAGAYAYTLHKNGIATPTDGAWYLRSEMKPVDPPIPPVDPGIVNPIDPDIPLKLRYQPGAPVYEAYPQALLALNGLPTLQQRVGNRSWAAGNSRTLVQAGAPVMEDAGATIEGNGVWGRIEGGHRRVDTTRSTTGLDLTQNAFKLQAGIDVLLKEDADSKLVGGAFAHYANGAAKTLSEFDAINGGGKIETKGSGLGGSLTWYQDNGLYLDLQGRATWYRSDLSYDGGAEKLAEGRKGFGYALSMEGGKRFKLDRDWSLTPQAQLVYSRVKFDRFTDEFGSSVNLDKGESLEGRIGLALEQQVSWQNSKGLTNRSHVYGIANLNYEFMGGTRIDLAGIKLENRPDRLAGGVGIGGSYNWDNDRYSVYAEGLANTSLENFGDSYSFTAQLGFRAKW